MSEPKTEKTKDVKPPKNGDLVTDYLTGIVYRYNASTKTYEPVVKT